jgi:peptidoglycan hydrolase CwlO-like protein
MSLSGYKSLSVANVEGTNATTQQINNLENEVDEINTEIIEINNSINQIEEDIDDIEQQQINMIVAIIDNTNSINSIYTDINNIENDITDIQNDIGNIDTDISNLEDRVEDLEEKTTNITYDSGVTTLDGYTQINNILLVGDTTTPATVFMNAETTLTGNFGIYGNTYCEQELRVDGIISGHPTNGLSLAGGTKVNGDLSLLFNGEFNCSYMHCGATALFGDEATFWNGIKMDLHPDDIGGQSNIDMNNFNINNCNTLNVTNINFPVNDIIIGQQLSGSRNIIIGATTYDPHPSNDTHKICIGNLAGSEQANFRSINIGTQAGKKAGQYSINMGWVSGQNAATGQRSVNIGNGSAQNGCGSNSINIGANAGQNTSHAGVIILNASGSALDSTQTNSLFIRPIRSATNGTILYYNTTTYEVTQNNDILNDVSTLQTDVTNLDNRVSTIEDKAIYKVSRIDNYTDIGSGTVSFNVNIYSSKTVSISTIDIVKQPSGIYYLKDGHTYAFGGWFRIANLNGFKEVIYRLAVENYTTGEDICVYEWISDKVFTSNQNYITGWTFTIPSIPVVAANNVSKVDGIRIILILDCELNAINQTVNIAQEIYLYEI